MVDDCRNGQLDDGSQTSCSKDASDAAGQVEDSNIAGISALCITYSFYNYLLRDFEKRNLAFKISCEFFLQKFKLTKIFEIVNNENGQQCEV